MNPVTVCAFASELLEARSGWAGGKLNATSTFLEPLSPPECVVLIENLVGQAELTKGIETGIADAADGNPLLVEEMLAVLIDDGVLVPRNGRWVATDLAEVLALAGRRDEGARASALRSSCTSGRATS